MAAGQAGPPQALRDEEVGRPDLRVADHALGRRDRRASSSSTTSSTSPSAWRTRRAPTPRPTAGWSRASRTPSPTIVYVIALVLLGMHLRHGIWSATQTLGQSNRRRERTVNVFAIVFATLLIAGYLVIPAAVVFGLVRLGQEATLHASRTLHRRRAHRRHQGPHRRPDRRASGASASSAARLVNPANRRKLTVIVVGTGLAGGSAAATLGEAGYKVKSFWYQDSPRRAHSVAAQGGINAAKNYRNDGDSVHRLFYDTVKGGDFRSRESNVLPAGRGQRQHHRPVRRAGRALRPRVRRPARQPLLRWRPGVAHLLRPRPDRPAAALRRLPGPRAADRGRQRRAARAHRDARPDRRRRPRPRHRRPRPGHR